MHVPYQGARTVVSTVGSSVGTVSEDRCLCTVGTCYSEELNYHWLPERLREVLDRYRYDESEVNTLTVS